MKIGRFPAHIGDGVRTEALARKLTAWFWRAMVKGDDYVVTVKVTMSRGWRITRSRCVKPRSVRSSAWPRNWVGKLCRWQPLLEKRCGLLRDRFISTA